MHDEDLSHYVNDLYNKTYKKHIAIDYGYVDKAIKEMRSYEWKMFPWPQYGFTGTTYTTNSLKQPKSMLTKLSALAKKIFDEDTRKLVEAGLLDSELEITELGRRELESLLFMQNKAELVKVAEERIQKEKESKQ